MADNVIALVQPAPRKYTPRAPSTLGPVGKAEWKKVITRLGENLTDDHLALVQSYCEAFEASSDCAATLKKQGRFLQGLKGQPPKQHPAVRAQLAYSQQMLRLAEKLGIVSGATPKDKKVPDGPSAPLDY
ncbi:phage terminase small subunit P27 family [Devosia sp. 63-57]|uniref:phage terminase small subunit P27 family n=1 Tax=Devosia sp. 63-57 TaxID=1895751 RepID=UPI00086D6C7B|nr:phage terminase small subunit P27 family [Devosia sp. 63-57]ODT47065.1 MAG: hypothetical protein ABS74_12170 [Pelagibacterium sp. SCN 63-126]ODU88880.1 MAG: hypothetical protein ABT14_01040 [Pelagibacterium sp. SCN 63-17]OJX43225.1 MAG: hypothetical protein BGO80_17705 [Devosia sp. 63-57]